MTQIQKITIKLSLTPAEMEVLAIAMTQVAQENRDLAKRVKHQANFYKHCLAQADHADSVLTKLQAWEVDNLVKPHQACPNCGERQIDHLEFRPGSQLAPRIHCTTCDTNYDIPEW